MEAKRFLLNEQVTESTAYELVERMAKQDQIALQEFYERYSKLVFSLVLKVLNCRTDAEEVTLEVFWQIWQQASQYQENRGSVVAWLVMIARSRAIDRRRSRDRTSNTLYLIDNTNMIDSSPDYVYNPEENFYSSQRREAVVNALSEMSDKQRMAIELAYFAGLSQSEIATQLQEPLGTVKTRIRSGIQILREKLKRYL
ncbi:MAG: sigma-70 family RNA polymerase sigma factor [Acidobacteria bacterium]|nr:sigma-70 family RNA polymerase sigma factor [Acidobacteriota bacterium]